MPLVAGRGLRGLCVWLCLAANSALPGPLGAIQFHPDSAELHDRARSAQREFEAFHRARLPWAADGWGGSCDEQIGFICLRFDNDFSWEPAPEDPRVVAARDDLLSLLEALGRQIPGDRWIQGQRVRYLGEEGAWGEAELVARECSGEPEWWCFALLGYVQHRAGRPSDALESFQEALRLLGPEEAREWMDPTPLLQYPATRWLREQEEEGEGNPVGRFWALADPLFLTPGNERLTEHLARRFGPYLYRDSALTLGFPWGSSLDELLLRYGFEAGWEKTRPDFGEAGGGSVVEHHHPESRGLLPPFEALEDPGALAEGVWVAQDEGPRSASAPVRAPLIVDGTGQTAVLRRDGGLLVVAAYDVPDDELLRRRRRAGDRAPASSDGGSEEPRPPSWEPSAAMLSRDTLAGLFLLADTEARPPLSALGVGARGVLRLSAPPGRYLLSLELWNPAGRWGARLRHGVDGVSIPPDVPSLSDLLLLDATGAPPASLSEALDRMRPSTQISDSTNLAVAWEVYGLRGRGEVITFHLRAERDDRGLVRRAFERLGLFGHEPALTITWSEAGPGEPGPVLRSVDLHLTDLDPGKYILRLEMELPYRSKVMSEKRITVY